MTLRKLFFQTATTFLLLVLGLATAVACSCRPPQDLTTEDYLKADLIFEGTITSMVVDKESYTKVATFKITENIKAGRNMETVEISTAFDSAACGLSFKKGQSWYLWARKDKNGTYSSGICSRSVELADDVSERYYARYNKEKTFLDNLKAKRGRNRLDLGKGYGEGKMKNGMLCGKWKYYDTNGSLVRECKYKKGVERSCTEVAAPAM